MAMNAGKYISKQGALIAQGLDTKDAIAIMGGLTPMSVVDDRLLGKHLREFKKQSDKIAKFATEQIVQGYKASGEGDWDGMAKYFTRANHALRTYGDFSDRDLARVWRNARDVGKSQVERTEQRLLREGTKEQLNKRHRQMLGIE